jgi:DNA-binding NtrC family response regulator
MTANILIIDDEKLIRWTLEGVLRKEGYAVMSADSGEAGLKLVDEEAPDLILLDLRLPKMDGMEVLERVKEIKPDALVIILTAHGTVESAVEAMRKGAYDYLNKPFDVEETKLVIRKALETIELKKEVVQLRREHTERIGVDDIIGASVELAEILDLVKRIARSNATTILIQGESGTGKELLAKAVHQQSARSGKPFMAINCTALPETLVESELFGHEKGAFTDAKQSKKGLLEVAQGGTALLDEIGDVYAPTQAKLLRVIEEKSFMRLGGTRDIHVDVRIIATTNRDLSRQVSEGNFREDLYYRLKVVPIFIPPLRERPEDVLPLAKYFLDRYKREFRRHVTGLSPEAEALLRKYHWPGNVRELRNAIERAMILGSGDVITPDHLPKEIVTGPQLGDAERFTIRIPRGGVPLKDLEKEMVKQALELAGGNQVHAARLIGISRDALRNRMKKYGML